MIHKCVFISFTLIFYVISAERFDFNSNTITGTIKTPGFPKNYSENADITWEIAPRDEYYIELKIQHFETDKGNDWVAIYDLNVLDGNTFPIKRWIYSGSTPTQTKFLSPAGSGLQIRFNSTSGKKNYAGFIMAFIRYVPGDEESTCPQGLHTAYNEQSLDFVDRTSIESCMYQINSSETIEMKFSGLAMGRIEVYETENLWKNDFKLGYVNSLAEKTIRSRTGSVAVLGYATGSYTLNFKKIENVCHCQKGIHYIFNKWDYSSVGWPVEYCDNLNCTDNFFAFVSQQERHQFPSLRFSFKEFDIEEDYDYFSFFMDDKLIKRISSNKAFGSHRFNHLTFQSTKVTTQFVSDYSIVKKGYLLETEMILQEKECKCPALINGRISFRVPKKCDSVDCFWFVDAKDEFPRVILNATTKFGRKDEFIEISGKNSKLNHLILPSDLQLQKTMVIPKEEIKMIWYHLDTVDQAYDYSESFIDLELQWTEGCTCGPVKVEASSEWQMLSSPGYPNPYCASMDCLTEILAPQGKRLEINITKLELELNLDTLLIRDVNYNDGATTRAHLTGDLSTPVSLTNRFSKLRIHFHSDDSVCKGGYIVNYRIKAEPKSEPETGITVPLVGTLLGLSFIGIMIWLTMKLVLLRRTASKHNVGNWLFSLNSLQNLGSEVSTTA